MARKKGRLGLTAGEKYWIQASIRLSGKACNRKYTGEKRAGCISGVRRVEDLLFMKLGGQ